VQGLPISIGNLKKLSRLVIFRNKLSLLPDEIGGCESLREVSIA